MDKQLSRLLDEGLGDLLRGGLKGLEKESLRVSPDGSISQRRHPETLGAPLTNPYITTDYSEALAELITPPFEQSKSALDFLSETQKFVHDNLGEEILWATSMPCVLAGGDKIPIAEYGPSNAGLMKTVYRRGLGHRYGRTMQVIAGVHYNYSVNDAFWPQFQALRADKHELQVFKNRIYLALTRNLQRFGWLIPYLFGASPAVCKSFLHGKSTKLSDFDANTYFEPFATSLRMGDIGYTNTKEKGVGIKANYDDLDAYIASLTHAIETPSPMWERLGVVVNGRYEQLNANILQIENEYYSTVRPKPLLEGIEKPVLALKKRGVRYVELRSLDVNAYHPLGVSEEQLHFLEAFIIFCLLLESPPISMQEQREIDQNLGAVAHRGRDPALYLLRQGRELKLRQWASEICGGMVGICEVLDGQDAQRPYTASLRKQLACVEDPESTPSAIMLQEMRDRGEGFYHFARRLSQQHHDYFRDLDLSPEREAFYRAAASDSHAQQRQIETAPQSSFDQFLADYYAQR